MSELFYDENQIESSAYARVLLKGLPKTGKTTSILTSAPGPICVLNCDGPDAVQPAKRFGAKELKIADVTSASMWARAVDGACALAKEGAIGTIVVDTVTLLINNVLTLEYHQQFPGDSFAVYKETFASMAKGLNKLKKAPAHLFVVAHCGEDGKLDVEGKSKEVLPRLLNDIVYFDFDSKRNPRRAFHVGPSASGLSGSRSCDENKIIEADVKKLLDAFQLAY